MAKIDTMSIEDLLEEFRNEVNRAKQSYYSWKSIHDMATQEQNIFQAINKNASSWNIILHSLQTTFLITLGRIFDTNQNFKEDLTIKRFLNRCNEEISQFSKTKLEERKRRDWKGASEDDLKNYLVNAYEPTKYDFDLLNTEADQHIKTYKKIYQPIRHKILAHKDMSVSTFELFNQTNIGEIEAALLFLHQVNIVIWEFLVNGRKIELQNYDLKKDIDFIKNDIKQILEHLA